MRDASRSLPKLPERADRAWSVEPVQAFLRAAREQVATCSAWVVARRAARELLNVRWRGVDFHAQTLAMTRSKATEGGPYRYPTY